MSYCKLCKKYFLANINEYIKFKDTGPFGFDVVAEVGKMSYRCVCKRCGNKWLSRSEDVAFQFNEPEKYKKQQEFHLNFHEILKKERQRGYSILIYPKTMIPMEYES
jgi:hypothetical protein